MERILQLVLGSYTLYRKVTSIGYLWDLSDVYDVPRLTILTSTLDFFFFTLGVRRGTEVSFHVEKVKCQFIASNSSALSCSHPLIGVIVSIMQTFKWQYLTLSSMMKNLQTEAQYLRVDMKYATVEIIATSAQNSVSS